MTCNDNTALSVLLFLKVIKSHTLHIFIKSFTYVFEWDKIHRKKSLLLYTLYSSYWSSHGSKASPVRVRFRSLFWGWKGLGSFMTEVFKPPKKPPTRFNDNFIDDRQFNMPSEARKRHWPPGTERARRCSTFSICYDLLTRELKYIFIKLCKLEPRKIWVKNFLTPN